MRRHIPSLSALETFEAVVRHGSATGAAEELGRTQSAVSRQILNLEAFLQQPLFSRAPGGMLPNAAGRYLFEAISRALDRLEQAVARTSTLGLDRRTIALRVWPTLGARWLMSRLARMPAAELGVEVRLSINVDTNEDLEGLGVDAAILFGTGDWRELTSYRLIDEELVVVAEPGAVERLGTDVSAYPWLHMESRPDAWRHWIEARGDPGTPVQDGPKYAISLLVEMACLGQGVAALPRFYVERELANGQLVAPFGAPVVTGRGYYLCYLNENAQKPELVAFKDWLIGTR